MSCLCKRVDPDQLASEEAKSSGSTLFVIQYVNICQQSGSSNLIGWKFEKGMASLSIQQDKGSYSQGKNWDMPIVSFE